MTLAPCQPLVVSTYTFRSSQVAVPYPTGGNEAGRGGREVVTKILVGVGVSSALPPPSGALARKPGAGGRAAGRIADIRTSKYETSNRPQRNCW